MPHLPSEILLNILTNLTPSAIPENQCWYDDELPDLFTILSLCLVSRELCRLAQPLLYTTIFTPDDGEYDYEHKERIRFRKLLRTLLSRPDLAKQANFVGWVWVDPDKDIDKLVADAVQDVALPDLELRTHFLNSAVWYNDWISAVTKGGDQDADNTLLFALTPNLQRMQTRLYYNRPQPFAVKLVDSIAANQSLRQSDLAFSKLNRLEVFHGDTEGGFCLKRLAPYLALPNLTSFYGWACHSGDGDFAPSVPKSTLKSLEFERSVLSSGTIRALVTSCTALEDFSLETGDCTVGSESIIWSTIMAGLHTRLETLHSLSITDYEYDDFADVELPPMGVFTPFKRLRHLVVHWDVLFGSDYSPNKVVRTMDVLPKSLQTLHLWNRDALGGDERALALLHELADQRDEASELCEFLVEGLTNNGGGEDEVMELVKRFAEMGVDFQPF